MRPRLSGSALRSGGQWSGSGARFAVELESAAAACILVSPSPPLALLRLRFRGTVKQVPGDKQRCRVYYDDGDRETIIYTQRRWRAVGRESERNVPLAVAQMLKAAHGGTSSPELASYAHQAPGAAPVAGPTAALAAAAGVGSMSGGGGASGRPERRARASVKALVELERAPDWDVQEILAEEDRDIAKELRRRADRVREKDAAVRDLRESPRERQSDRERERDTTGAGGKRGDERRNWARARELEKERKRERAIAEWDRTRGQQLWRTGGLGLGGLGAAAAAHWEPAAPSWHEEAHHGSALGGAARGSGGGGGGGSWHAQALPPWGPEHQDDFEAVLHELGGPRRATVIGVLGLMDLSADYTDHVLYLLKQENGGAPPPFTHTLSHFLRQWLSLRCSCADLISVAPGGPCSDLLRSLTSDAW